MNSKEDLFVQKFITSKYRSRVLYELSSKKREQAIIHINEHIDERYAIFCSGEYDYEILLNTVAKKFNVNEKCYLISCSSFDKTEMAFKEALNMILNDCGANVLICGENLAVVREEVFMQRPYIWVLYRDAC